jgi:hypothetical protein
MACPEMFYILISFLGPCRPCLLGLTIVNDIDLNPANKMKKKKKKYHTARTVPILIENNYR